MGPAAQQRIEILDRPLQRSPAPIAQPRSHLLLQTLYALRCNSWMALALHGARIAEELSLPWPRHRAFPLIDAQPQDFLKEDPDPAHHTLARRPTAHINVAVIGIADERKPPSLKLPVQVRQQNVR
jgi:hypothetical protein